jgi:Holliday junction resolvase RusA-like endonuclease
MPPEYKAHLLALQWHLRLAMGSRAPLLGLVVVTMRFARPVKRDHRKDGDFDNYAKHLCDAANGIVWKDDRQIIEAHIFVVEAQEGCIELAWAKL